MKPVKDRLAQNALNFLGFFFKYESEEFYHKGHTYNTTKQKGKIARAWLNAKVLRKIGK